MRALLFFCFFLGFTLVACSSNRQLPSHETTSLAGPEWQLVEIRGKAVTAGQHRAPHIQFEEANQRVTGHSGCNRFFGGYIAADIAPHASASLNLSALGSTKMACLDADANQLEHQFLALLQQVDAYALTVDQLVLSKGGEAVLRFAQQ